MEKLSAKQQFELALERLERKYVAVLVENELLKMELELYRGKDEKDG